MKAKKEKENNEFILSSKQLLKIKKVYQLTEIEFRFLVSQHHNHNNKPNQLVEKLLEF